LPPVGERKAKEMTQPKTLKTRYPSHGRLLGAASIAAVLACLALGAGSASAATVHGGNFGLSYQAAPGETNDLNIHVDWWDTSGFHVDDPGAVIAVSGNCQSIDIHHAYCPNVLNRVLDIDAGDGNDTVHATSNARIHGGPGNDRLYSDDAGLFSNWHGDGTLWGDAGDDQLWGNNGEDTLDDGAGARLQRRVRLGRPALRDRWRR
jgi:Ca2+-binding RTX toxin-like protein